MSHTLLLRQYPYPVTEGQLNLDRSFKQWNVCYMFALVWISLKQNVNKC